MKTKHVFLTTCFLFAGFMLNAQLKVRSDGSVLVAYTGYQHLSLGNYTSGGVNNGQYAFEVDGSSLKLCKPWPSPYYISRNYYMYINLLGGVGIGKIPGYAGRVLDVNGPVYGQGFFVSSDKRLKKDIIPLADKTSMLYRLNGKSYKKHVLNEQEESVAQHDPNGKSIEAKNNNEIQQDTREFTEFGFIAQELEEIYPELVTKDTLGYYSINYTGLIPLLVEVVKEQKAEIDALKQTCYGNNAGLKKVGASTGIVDKADGLTYPVLNQNVPNPFSVSTTISYSLPATTTHAAIYIYDMNGVQLKSYPIVERGSGNVTIQGYEFNAGMYLYALIADEEVIDTKRMILTK